MDRRMTMRTQRQTIGEVQTTEFPPIPVKPPKLKTKGINYPSGNATGTEACMPFEMKLKELLIAAKTPPKK
jgi:hypothetical protein